MLAICLYVLARARDHSHAYPFLKRLRVVAREDYVRRNLNICLQVDVLTKRFEDGVGLEDLLLHPRRDVGGDGAEVLHDVLGRLGLAGAGLSRDDEALVGALRLQVLVRRLGEGENVGRKGAEFLTMVRENALLKVRTLEDFVRLVLLPMSQCGV